MLLFPCDGVWAGDNAQAAAQVAHRVGILDYKAAMKPEDKLKFVLDFNASESSHPVAPSRCRPRERCPNFMFMSSSSLGVVDHTS